jgi:hypothetical protein
LFHAASFPEGHPPYRNIRIARSKGHDGFATDLINEAITNYIELHAYLDALVRRGLEE